MPPGARAVDLAGATVIPGVIDAHVHVAFARPAAVAAGGVTTVRDLGSPPAARRTWSDAAAPRLLTAGRILTAPGGYPTRSWGGDGTAREVADAADAGAAVAEQVGSGATWVKVALEDFDGQPVLPEESLAAIVGAAHAAGVRVTAHVGSARALVCALDSGVDELAHLPLHDLSPAEARAIAAAGVVVVPTLAVPRHAGDGITALGAFRAAGGRVVYGSDLGNSGTRPGIWVAELRALHAAGMSRREILAAATVGAAAHLGLAALGRVAVGAHADLVVLDGDPLADLDAYAHVRAVIAAGDLIT